VLLDAGVLLSTLLLQDAPPAADSTPRARVRTLPVVSYSEVTGLQYGVTVFTGFRVGSDSLTRNSSISTYLARTAKGHDKWYAQLDRWSGRNTSRWRVRAERNSYPLPLFGIGAGTPDSSEEWYSSGVTTVQLFTQRLLRHSTYVHAGTRYVRSRLRENEADGLLAQGTLRGAAGSDVLIGELGLVVDSRDRVGAARTGTYIRAIPSLASKSAGSDFSFRRLTIDARQYWSLRSNSVAAIQLQYDGIAGSVPFDLLPMIGADTSMRGYARGRFRDRHALASQVELRTAYWRRVGLVTFAGAGTVAPRFAGLREGSWFPSVGVGLRYALVPKDRTNVRVDLGLGRGSFGVSLGIGEAF
jgi:outer membrane protein assembly factor BamA